MQAPRPRWPDAGLASGPVQGLAGVDRLPGVMHRKISLLRAVAVLLLAWLAFHASASALASCCAGIEPCCVVVDAGQGCASCAAPAALLATAPSAGQPPCSGRVASVGRFPFAKEDERPWKPPD